MSHNKRAGTLYEVMFTQEALSRGLDVCQTEGDYLPYDCIVDNGNKLWRIQVKGTARKNSPKGYNITTAMGAKTSRKNHYKEDAYDILAALVIGDMDKYWYIIPKQAIGRNLTIKLFPNPSSQAKFEKYRHGWDLLIC